MHGLLEDRGRAIAVRPLPSCDAPPPPTPLADVPTPVAWAASPGLNGHADANLKNLGESAAAFRQSLSHSLYRLALEKFDAINVQTGASFVGHEEKMTIIALRAIGSKLPGLISTLLVGEEFSSKIKLISSIVSVNGNCLSETEEAIDIGSIRGVSSSNSSSGIRKGNKGRPNALAIAAALSRVTSEQDGSVDLFSFISFVIYHIY